MKKKNAAVLFVLLLVVAVMGAAFFYVAHLYRGTGLSLIAQWDKAYEYNGKLLLSEDREEGVRVLTVGKTDFETLPLTRVDLTPFGFEGETISYYRVKVQKAYGVTETFLYTPEQEGEGFWPVLKEERLVYTDRDGARYCIHPSDGLCYPMFSDSIDGVDPYGKDVLAFSANGSYAIGMTGDTVTVYHTDPMDDSLRVVDVKKVSIKEYGAVTFGAFAGETTAYFKTNKGYIALDCTTGRIAQSLLDREGRYSQPINRVYAQRLDVEEKEGRAYWSHLLLGTERKTPKLKDFSSFEIFSVSPEGAYVAVKAVGKTEEILISTEKRAFSLSSVLDEGTEVIGVDFIYENLIYVTLKDPQGKTVSRCYKVCF
ncbi:MAG: hypothetical protein IJC26_01570 [Clostridia bacterium]|nr:hypothetical protein [Clostridia bacterium]